MSAAADTILPEYRARVPHQRHQTERPRLQLFERHHLCHRRPYDAHIAIPSAGQTPRNDRHGKIGREPKHQARDHGAEQTQEDGWLSAILVREATPRYAHDRLA